MATTRRQDVEEQERAATSIQNRKKKLARLGPSLICSASVDVVVDVLSLCTSSSLPCSLSDRVQESISQKKESDGRVRRQMNRVLMGYGGNSGCTHSSC